MGYLREFHFYKLGPFRAISGYFGHFWPLLVKLVVEFTGRLIHAISVGLIFDEKNSFGPSSLIVIFGGAPASS